MLTATTVRTPLGDLATGDQIVIDGDVSATVLDVSLSGNTPCGRPLVCVTYRETDTSLERDWLTFLHTSVPVVTP